MNKKGQIGILAFIFGIILFVILWAVWLGDQINYWVGLSIASGDVTGIEAFLLSNMNLWIGVILFAGIAWFTIAGGSN